MPSSTGTLALVSQIPSSLDYVDLTTNQTIGGTKTFSSQILANSSDAGATPWTAPKYSFSGHANSGFYFATDSSTYESVGTSINGKFILFTGTNLSTNASYLLVANTDATLMGGFVGTSSTGPGYLYTDGYLRIADTSASTSSSTGALRCQGGAYFGATSLFNAQVQLNSGSATSPGLSFSSSPDTGIFSLGSGFLNFAINGINRIEVSSARIDTSLPLYLPNGSASVPALTFSNEGSNDTGMYFISDGNIGFSSNGALRWDYNSTRINSSIRIDASGGLKVGTNGTTHTQLQFGRASNSGGTGEYTITFPVAFSSAPTVSIVAERNSGFLFFAQLLGVSTTNFTYRYMFFTVAVPCASYVAADPHTLHWVARN